MTALAGEGKKILVVGEGKDGTETLYGKYPGYRLLQTARFLQLRGTIS